MFFGFLTNINKISTSWYYYQKGDIMKKALLTFLSAFILCGCGSIANSNNDLILPLFSTNSNNENKIWIGTFQLVFNDMKNNIIKNDVYFVDEEPTDELKGLNGEEFNSSMLNESSYYTSYGKTSLKEKEKIKKGIKQKFNETSDIIDKLDWTQGEGRYYAYAMLKKQFEFLKEFDKLPPSKFNDSDKLYDYFGIDNNSKDLLYNNVAVLFYNGEEDYAVKLNTKNGDIVYLYRNDENKSLNNLYKQMLDKKNKYSGNRHFEDIDTLKVPNMKFNKMREYNELCNKVIRGTSIHFSKAIETVQFELDNKGGKVKSEAILMTDNAVAVFEDKPKPRHFNFDKTFVMFLIDSGKTNPYMALRVHNLNEFQN